MNPDTPPNIWDRTIAGLEDLIETLEAGTPLNRKYTVRFVELDDDDKAYDQINKSLF